MHSRRTFVSHSSEQRDPRRPATMPRWRISTDREAPASPVLRPLSAPGHSRTPQLARRADPTGMSVQQVFLSQGLACSPQRRLRGCRGARAVAHGYGVSRRGRRCGAVCALSEPVAADPAAPAAIPQPDPRGTPDRPPNKQLRDPVLLHAEARAKQTVQDVGGDGALHKYMTLPGAWWWWWGTMCPVCGGSDAGVARLVRAVVVAPSRL